MISIDARKLADKNRKARTLCVPRIKAKIQDAAAKGRYRCVCRCDKVTATALRSEGYRVFRLPPYALIIW